MPDPRDKAIDTDRYTAAARALQSATKLELDLDAAQGHGACQTVPETSSGSPKHLRVGLDLRAADHGALVRLLIEKGVFTEAEYLSVIADGAEREAREAGERASTRLGRPVTFA